MVGLRLLEIYKVTVKLKQMQRMVEKVNSGVERLIWKERWG